MQLALAHDSYVIDKLINNRINKCIFLCILGTKNDLRTVIF